MKGFLGGFNTATFQAVPVQGTGLVHGQVKSP